MSITSRLTQFVAETRFDKLQPHTVGVARTAIIDCVAAALAGSAEESAQICVDIVSEESGREEATIYGRDRRTSALGAAFANGTAAHGSDFDHSFVVGGQPTAPIIPSILALAEARGASGPQVLEAYAAGFEVTARLALAVVAAAGDGWHANSVFGAFGATAGCCRLLNLSQDQVATAFAMTASMTGGLTANFGTMTKPLHVGLAARNGVLAAKLAQAGFTANPDTLETPKGFFDSFYPGRPIDEQQFERLGQVYSLDEHGVRLKPYPCGGLTHTAVYSTINLCQEHSITPDAIDHITVDVPQTTYTTIAFPLPETTLQAKFCMPYLVARAAIDRAVTLDSFTEAAIRDAGALALLKRIEMRVDPAQQSGRDGSRPSTVTIHLRNGQTHSLHAQFPKGGAEIPMTAAELDAKFLSCASGVISPSAADQALAHLRHLEDISHIAALTTLLRGS